MFDEIPMPAPMGDPEPIPEHLLLSNVRRKDWTFDEDENENEESE